LLVFAFAVSTVAQVALSSISGTVLDPSGLPVVGAKVEVINEGTGARHEATTGSQGGFSVTAIQAGYYRVETTADGFKTSAVSSIKVDAGAARSVPPIRLELGIVSETVTVEGGAEIINTTNSVISNTVELKQIQDLPTLDRNPINLLDLQAGVNSNGRTNRTVNGLRTSATNMSLDGVNIQDNFIRTSSNGFTPFLPNVSQVSEFTLINSNSDPSAGYGSVQVNLTTPSGTNDWHGEVFWFHRNNKFAANDWFNNATGTEKPQLIQNQGGFTAGGPVVRDKLHVFGWYEIARTAEKETDTETLLTDTARQGIFSWVTQAPIDTGVTPLMTIPRNVARPAGVFSSTAQPITCASTAVVIPTGTICQVNLLNVWGLGIDPFVANLLSLLPTNANSFEVGDSSTGQILNTIGLRFNQSSGRERNNLGFKMDFTPTSAHSFSGTFAFNDDFVERPDIDTTPNVTPNVFNDDQKWFLAASHRWSPSGRFTNEARGGFALAPATFLTSSQFGDFVITDSADDSGQTAGGATFSFSNPIDSFRPQGRDTNTYTVQDNATYILGDHTTRFGFFFQRVTTEPFSGFNVPPSFDIGCTQNCPFTASNASEFLGSSISSQRTAANLLLSSLAGIVYQGSADWNVDPANASAGFIPNQINVRKYPLDNYALYFNDSWRLRPNFTLNVGVRWEYFSVFDEENGLFLTPVLPGNTRADMLALFAEPDPDQITIDLTGDKVGRRPYDQDWNNFAPQIGFAWDPWGDGRTSVRAGYSISYIQDEFFTSGINSTQMDGLSATSDLNATAFASISGTQTNIPGLPSLTAPAFQVPRTLLDNIIDFAGGAPDTLFTIDPELKTPYVQQWNLSVQREIGWNTAVEARYVGNHGVHLPRAIDFNQVIVDGPFMTDFLNARQNGFDAFALSGVFDAGCPSAVNPGCTPLPFFDANFFGGFLFLGFVSDMVEEGRAGELASLYHFNAIGSDVVARINPNASVVDALLNWSTSTYHAGILEVRRRPVQGIYFQANYAFSKVLSDSSGCRGTSCNANQNRFDPLLDIDFPDLEKSRAEYDVTHAFKANFLIDIPMGRGHNISSDSEWVNRLIDGWTISSIYTWQTGSPFSIFSNRGTRNRNGRSNTRNTAFTLADEDAVNSMLGLRFGDGVFYVPDAAINSATGTGVGDEAIVCTGFGPGQLCHPDPGTNGNLGRNAFDGPDVFLWDFSLIKKTAVTERVGVEFRAEFFNFLNHPVFLVRDQSLDSSSFGRVTETVSDRRRVQFTLKVTF